MDLGSTNIRSLKASYPPCVYTVLIEVKYTQSNNYYLSNKTSNMFRQISSHYQADCENKNKMFPAAREVCNLEQFVQ